MDTQSELERFARIWDDDCQKVNSGKIDIIKNLFLATVDENIRDDVELVLNENFDA